MIEIMRKFNLSAVSTYFQPSRHKKSPSLSNATYLPKDPNLKPSQIDYAIVSRRWATSVRNCKVKWGIACQRWGRHFDHGLIEFVFRTRTSRIKNDPAKDFSVLSTDPEVQHSFNQKIAVNLTKHDVDEKDPAACYANLCNAVAQAVESVLPTKRTTPLRKSQGSSLTKELYEKRRAGYDKMSTEERRDAQNAISRSCRDDYIAYIDSVLRDMEAADRTGNYCEMT